MCPRLLTIYGPIAIQSYGFMIVFSLFMFLGLTYNHPRRVKIISGERYLNTVFFALFVGVIGGRILGVIADWSSFKLNPSEIFFPWVGGFVVLGAIVANVIVLPIYLWHYKVDTLKLFDFVGVYIPLMQAVARFGCLFAGCCYGAIASPDAWWTVTFTNLDAHIPIHLLGIPLLPTQLYMGAASLFIFLMMFFLQGYFTRLGQAAFFYLISENISRVTIDFWRGDRGDLYPLLATELSQFQIYSLLFLVICFIMLTYFTLCGKPVEND